MDQNTFFRVMVDIFIPYVETVRERVEGSKHAVLIVDGDGSRYYLPSLYILRELVLPAHTSLVAQ